MIKELLKKENLLHIAIILLGTILILIPAFHSNIWFDESYSVAYQIILLVKYGQ